MAEVKDAPHLRSPAIITLTPFHQLTPMTRRWRKKKPGLGSGMVWLSKWLQDNSGLVLQQPHSGLAWKTVVMESPPMGNISGLLLCMEREGAQSKNPHRFMNNVKWSGYWPEAWKKWDWKIRNWPMTVTTKCKDIFITTNAHQRALTAREMLTNQVDSVHRCQPASVYGYPSVCTFISRREKLWWAWSQQRSLTSTRVDLDTSTNDLPATQTNAELPI